MQCPDNKSKKTTCPHVWNMSDANMNITKYASVQQSGKIFFYNLEGKIRLFIIIINQNNNPIQT